MHSSFHRRTVDLGHTTLRARLPWELLVSLLKNRYLFVGEALKQICLHSIHRDRLVFFLVTTHGFGVGGLTFWERVVKSRLIYQCAFPTELWCRCSHRLKSDSQAPLSTSLHLAVGRHSLTTRPYFHSSLVVKLSIKQVCKTKALWECCWQLVKGVIGALKYMLRWIRGKMASLPRRHWKRTKGKS